MVSHNILQLAKRPKAIMLCVRVRIHLLRQYKDLKPAQQALSQLQAPFVSRPHDFFGLGSEP